MGIIRSHCQTESRSLLFDLYYALDTLYTSSSHTISLLRNYEHLTLYTSS
jgi:hypothetical protein